MKKALRYTVIFALIFWSCKQGTKDSGTAVEGDRISQNSTESGKNNTLKSASSPYEDLIEFAMDRDTSNVYSSIKIIASQKKEVEALMGKMDREQFNSFYNRLVTAQENEDFDAIALNSAEAYKRVIMAMDGEALKVPKEVSYLDYVGFKLLAELNVSEINWQNIQKTVDEAVGYWDLIKDEVKKDKGLHNLMIVTVEGLQQGQSIEDKEMLLFGAKVTLEAVDLLEGFYETQ